jgi:hypothetical protein
VSVVKRIWRLLLSLLSSFQTRRKEITTVEQNPDLAPETIEYRDSVFVGVSPSPRRPGKPVSLQEALEDAYQQAGPGRLEIVKIEITGTNPINEYRVIGRQTA